MQTAIIETPIKDFSANLTETREMVQKGMKKVGLSGEDMRKLIKEIRYGKKPLCNFNRVI